MTRHVGIEFVGRVDELGRLDRLLRAATNGAGQVALLLGESGVGKSRLALEVADRAADAGMLVGHGRAAADEGCPPYWPFRQVLRGLSAADPAEADREPAFVTDLDAPDLTASDGASTPLSVRRFALFETVTEHLTATASARGLVVLIDDLQWADAGSLHLLVHLAGPDRRRAGADRRHLPRHRGRRPGEVDGGRADP